MLWKDLDSLSQAISGHAMRQLDALLEPPPDEGWRQSTHAYFKDLGLVDKEAREALRVYDRSKVKARALFERREIPIEFDLRTFERLPPAARMLLLALVDREPRLGALVERSQRQGRVGHSVEWLQPRFTSHGFVVSAFEELAVVPPKAPEMRWGHKDVERRRLSNLQLAWVHAYLFPADTKNGIPRQDPYRGTVESYLEEERRRIKNAREHYAEDPRSPRVAARGKLRRPTYWPVHKRGP
jgi:hypothetical protein